MKILHLSTDDANGGAARAAYRLHKGLRGIRVDSRMLVRRRAIAEDPYIEEFTTGWGFWRRLGGYLRSKSIQSSLKHRNINSITGPLFNVDRSRFGKSIFTSLPDCEVINLHWVAGDFFDYEGFFGSISPKTPVVWTLHDMNPFTGGCHYDGDCMRYKQYCRNCPVLRNLQYGHQRKELHLEKAEDLSSKIFSRKKRVIEGALKRGVRLHIVSPSEWLAQCAKDSAVLGGLPVTVIPYGLDQDVFKPCDSKGVRQSLGIPEGAKVIITMATSLNDPRKGFQYVLELAQKLSKQDQDIFLLCIGANESASCSENSRIVFTGQIKDDRLLALLLAAGDIFLITSLQDNLPNTVMEAMACALPIAGFDVGGVSDMVRQNKTGILVDCGDAEGLAAVIEQAFRNRDGLRRMGANARQVVLEDYTQDIQARSYQRLYQDLLR